MKHNETTTTTLPRCVSKEDRIIIRDAAGRVLRIALKKIFKALIVVVLTVKGYYPQRPIDLMDIIILQSTRLILVLVLISGIGVLFTIVLK